MRHETALAHIPHRILPECSVRLRVCFTLSDLVAASLRGEAGFHRQRLNLWGYYLRFHIPVVYLAAGI